MHKYKNIRQPRQMYVYKPEVYYSVSCVGGHVGVDVHVDACMHIQCANIGP